jgi:hypothetical protein
MTNAELTTQNAKLREALTLIKRDLTKSIERFLDEAEHSKAVGAGEAQFAATVAAATVDGALRTITFHTSALPR